MERENVCGGKNGRRTEIKKEEKTDIQKNEELDAKIRSESNPWC